MNPTQAQTTVDWLHVTLAVLTALGPVVTWLLTRFLPSQSKWRKIADALIEGVEVADKDGVKAAIQKVAENKGVQDVLADELVRRGFSQPPPAPPAPPTVGTALVLLSLLLGATGCTGVQARSDLHAATLAAQQAVLAAKDNPQAIGNAFTALSVLAGKTGPAHDGVVAAQRALAAGALDQAQAALDRVAAATAPPQ